jgi:hypothetical protein
MNRRRVGENRGSKETDGCPLTQSGLLNPWYQGMFYLPSPPSLWK